MVNEGADFGGVVPAPLALGPDGAGDPYPDPLTFSHELAGARNVVAPGQRRQDLHLRGGAEVNDPHSAADGGDRSALRCVDCVRGDLGGDEDAGQRVGVVLGFAELPQSGRHGGVLGVQMDSGFQARPDQLPEPGGLQNFVDFRSQLPAESR